jgi:hypothetical protein
MTSEIWGDQSAEDPMDNFGLDEEFMQPEVKPKTDLWTRLKAKIKASIQNVQIEIGNRRVTKKYGLQKEYRDYKKNRKRS